MSGPFFYGLLCCVAFNVLGGVKNVLADEFPSLRRQADIVRLVRQDCGSCHGMTLAGGLGPALLPALLHDKPAESLVATILYGRPGTPMPPWGDFLSENEARWIVDKLQKGFPDEP
ncbi:MAG: cytochrome c [Sulfuricella denitrificans]|nr:cytochrome c [Sulfuricella denitrificans]